MYKEDAKTQNPQPTSWERIKSVINMAQMSTNGFARHIGLPRGENLYQIKRGNNGVSLNLANRIVAKFPEVSKLWLLTGDGQMICGDTPAGPWSNIGTPNSETFRAWATVYLLPIFIENHAPDPIAAALTQVDKLREQLNKGRFQNNERKPQ